MSQLAKRMLDAGWLVRPNDEGTWTVLASNTRRFHFENGLWRETKPELLRALEQDEHEIAKGEKTPFLTRSRLSAAPIGTPPNPLIGRLCREGHTRKQTVVRFGGGRDTAGHDALVDAGAIRVEEVDPNFHLNPTALDLSYRLTLCLHVLDCLPPLDRQGLYRQIRSCTREDGSAWISFYGATALPSDATRTHHQDGYVYTQGRHSLFYKAYTQLEAESELLRELGGSIRHHFPLFHDLIYCWSPRD